MSVEFIIIPVDPEAESYANTIKSHITSIINNEVMIDTNYSSPLTKKLIKYKKKHYNIITITGESVKDQTLNIRYGEKGLKPEMLSLDDFIELIKSYYDEGTKQVEEPVKEEVETSSIEVKEEQKGGCYIM